MNNKTIKMCFISHSSGIAGAEKVFPELLEALIKMGINVYVILPENGPIENVLTQKNIKFKILKYRRWLNSDKNILSRFKRLIINIYSIFCFIKYFKQINFDVIYTNTSTIISGAISAKILSIPHIWHFREFGEEDYGYNFDLGRYLSKYLIRHLADLYLTNSVAVKNKYSKFINEDNIKVLYESYYINEYYEDNDKIKINKNIFNCIMIGTLHKAKGHLDALQAIKILINEKYNIKLYIVGTGNNEYKSLLLDYINSNGLNKYVNFTGHLNNPEYILRQCNVLLMCSKNEAYGLVTLEAMKNGIPVIGTNSGGTSELIDHDYTGFLYQHQNVAELCFYLKLLIENKIKYNYFKENSKIKANTKFTPENYFNQTYKMIISCL
ncbi:MAG: glycosyltransferase [Ignavibacteria bacterium]|nr:glycosyltransferase [Ignavibacteria bacterium]